MATTPPPTINDPFLLDLAAANRDRIRVVGPIASRTDGYRSRYRQAVITVNSGVSGIQFTASLTGTLARLRPGTQVVVDLTLTGLVDLSNGLYMAERARLVTVGQTTERN
jgi:hypothetical protein